MNDHNESKLDNSAPDPFPERGGNGVPLSRKRPAHMPLVYSGNRAMIVFLTVCTNHRKAILGRDGAHALVQQAWMNAARWAVGRYMIMPNHIHLFCAPSSYPPLESIRAWMKYWKTLVSKQWPYPDEQPIWQQDCWDTQLRRGESYSMKREYVRNNPVRAGLVTTANSWPYQGELNVLTWHEQ